MLCCMKRFEFHTFGWVKWLHIILFGLPGAGMFIVGVSSAAWHFYFGLTAVHAEAEVVAYEAREHRESRPINSSQVKYGGGVMISTTTDYLRRFQFQVDNTIFDGASRQGLTAPGSVGEKIQVLYDPSNPNTVFIDEFTERYRRAAGLSFVGLIFLLFSGFGLLIVKSVTTFTKELLTKLKP